MGSTVDMSKADGGGSRSAVGVFHQHVAIGIGVQDAVVARPPVRVAAEGHGGCTPSWRKVDNASTIGRRQAEHGASIPDWGGKAKHVVAKIGHGEPAVRVDVLDGVRCREDQRGQQN